MESKQLIKAYDKFFDDFGCYDFRYCDPKKKLSLHKAAMRLCHLLAEELGMVKGAFDVRSNKGGVAVSGEITLHHELIYMQLSQTCLKSHGLVWLVRSCYGRKDFCGGHNNHLPVTRNGISALLLTARGILDREVLI